MCHWHLYCLSSHVYECVSVLWAHTSPVPALASSKPQSPLELYILPHSLGHWHHIYLYAHVFLFALLIDISGCHVVPPSVPVLSSPPPVIFNIMLHMDIPRKVCQMYRCDTWVLPPRLSSCFVYVSVHSCGGIPPCGRCSLRSGPAGALSCASRCITKLKNSYNRNARNNNNNIKSYNIVCSWHAAAPLCTSVMSLAWCLSLRSSSCYSRAAIDSCQTIVSLLISLADKYRLTSSSSNIQHVLQAANSI